MSHKDGVEFSADQCGLFLSAARAEIDSPSIGATLNIFCSSEVHLKLHNDKWRSRTLKI